jgi:adenine-specific DNA methylase
LAEYDLCLFDPPYFDYIAYSELSEFYRAWLGGMELGGESLLPEGHDPVGSFASRLSQCLRLVLRGLKVGRPIVFTFHSTSQLAWDAIGQALDGACLTVTALWPLRNDSHMGHHSSDGNCEWDVAIVCRRSRECAPACCASSVDQWVRAVVPLKIGDADRRSMIAAIDIIQKRFGSLL